MWQISFYEDCRGKSPVLDFIKGLDARDRAKINNTLRLLEEFGPELGMPHARRIKKGLWELRPGANRLFYFMQMKNRFVILHGYRKRSRKAPEKEIARALRYMNKLSEV